MTSANNSNHNQASAVFGGVGSDDNMFWLTGSRCNGVNDFTMGAGASQFVSARSSDLVLGSEFSGATSS